MKHQYIFIFLIMLTSQLLIAQDDLLNELEENTTENTFEQPAFKAMKIANLQSTKVAGKDDLYLYVSHRFGTLRKGLTTFFGFDDATTKIELVYGILKGAQIGVGRESLRKNYSGHIKFNIKTQSSKFPLNIVGYTTTNIRTDLRIQQYPRIKFADRLSYASQLLISRRLNNNLSLEIAPTYLRQNLVFEDFQKHDQVALGAGGRMKVSKRISLNVDYVYNFSRSSDSPFENPLTAGIDIETGGHVFQLLFSNAQSSNEPVFITSAEGEWFKDVFFGFNIVRVF